MLTDLTPQPPDKILRLMEMFRDDPRTDKIDLGVGVYKNAEGVTPVMRAVKAAERRLAEVQETKAYTSLSGDPDFCRAMRDHSPERQRWRGTCCRCRGHPAARARSGRGLN